MSSKWPKEKLKKNAAKFNTKTEWQKNCSGSYQAAKKLGKEFFDKCCDHMEFPFRWTDELLLESAAKCNTRKEWEKNNSGAYGTARKRGDEFFEKCCDHMEINKIEWTDELLLESAVKCNTKAEWQKNCSGAYKAAKKRGKEFYEKCCAHMDVQFKWTDKLLLESAAKCNTKAEWQKNCNGAYQAATKRGEEFFEKCCAHMVFPTKEISELKHDSSSYSIKRNLYFVDLYHSLKVDYFYKIGICCSTINGRFTHGSLKKDNVEIIKYLIIELSNITAVLLESIILNEYKDYKKYMGHVLKTVSGGTECFNCDISNGNLSPLLVQQVSKIDKYLKFYNFTEENAKLAKEIILKDLEKLKTKSELDYNIAA